MLNWKLLKDILKDIREVKNIFQPFKGEVCNFRLKYFLASQLNMQKQLQTRYLLADYN